MVDPKEQYVRIDSWGSLLIPLKLVPHLENAALVENEYRDGRNTIKLKKDGSLNFHMVPKEDVAAAIAAQRLEK